MRVCPGYSQMKEAANCGGLARFRNSGQSQMSHWRPTISRTTREQLILFLGLAKPLLFAELADFAALPQ
jgi:hypothetical protein